MRQNGKMSKKQPIFIAIVASTLFLMFQNCAKVGVEDTAVSADKLVGDLSDQIPIEDTPVVDNSNDVNTGADLVNQVPAPGRSPGNTGGNPQMPNGPGVVNPPVEMPKPPSTSNPPQQPVIPTLVIEPLPVNPIDPDRPKKPRCKHVSELGIDVTKTGEFISVRCLSGANDNLCAVVCHNPSGHEGNARTKLVKSDGSLKAHLGHGDKLGPCDSEAQQVQDQLACEEEDDHESHHGQGHHDKDDDDDHHHSHHDDDNDGRENSNSEHGKSKDSGQCVSGRNIANQ